MDNSTVVGDDASIFSMPLKESRPSTPSPIPLNPPLPGFISRTDIPVRTGSPLGRANDYPTRTPSRGTGYTPSDVYELNSLSERSYEPRELSDSASLLSHGREQSRSPPPNNRGGYI
jgi:hypothetical protein